LSGSILFAEWSFAELRGKLIPDRWRRRICIVYRAKLISHIELLAYSSKILVNLAAWADSGRAHGTRNAFGVGQIETVNLVRPH